MRTQITILLSFLVTVGFSQVRPDQFLEQTNPTNANFEFYSQKSGAPRRATFTNVKKGMVPFVTDTLAGVPTATGNVTNLGEFVWDQYGALWYIDGEGDAISFTGGGPIYVLPDTTAQTLVYAPAHGLTDTIALYGYVPVKADFTRANSSAVDSAFIAYAIDAPHPDSLLLVFSGILTYGAWHGKEISVQYYLQDDGSEDTTAGTVSIPTAIASDSLTLFLREVGTDIAGRLRRIAMPSPLITAFGGNPASPTDAVVQAAIVGTYLPAGLAQPGTVFTLSYATQSYNPIYQQTAPNTNPLTPSYAWLWDGAYATRIVNIPTSVNLQDTSYGVLGTLVLLPIDSLMAASVPTDTEVALWLDTNYTANNLRLANGSLLYFIGDSTRQNPQYIWHVIDDISYDSGDTDWEKILKRIKFPVVAADGNGIFDASNNNDTIRVSTALTRAAFTINGTHPFRVKNPMLLNATTGTPLYALEITENVNGSNGIFINNSHASGTTQIAFSESGAGTATWGAYIQRLNASNRLEMWTADTGPISFGTNNTRRMLISGTTGQLTLDGYAANALNNVDSSLYVLAVDATGDVHTRAASGLGGDGNGIYDGSGTIPDSTIASIPVGDFFLIGEDSLSSYSGFSGTDKLRGIAITPSDLMIGNYRPTYSAGQRSLIVLDDDYGNISFYAFDGNAIKSDLELEYNNFDVLTDDITFSTGAYGDTRRGKIKLIKEDSLVLANTQIILRDTLGSGPLDLRLKNVPQNDTLSKIAALNYTTGRMYWVHSDSLDTDNQTLSTSNDSLTISGGNTVKLPITELLRDSVTTTTMTVDLETRYQKVVQIDMTSATNLTLTVNNPTNAGVYTFHFLGISGTDNVTWPAAFYDANNTALGTDALTAGTMYTCYYSSADAKYFCK